MIKLYKKSSKGLEYWEAWENKGAVTLHWGTVGETGDSLTIKLKKGQRGEKVIATEAEPAKKQGYAPIEDDDHSQIVIQYRLKTWGTIKDLDTRYKIEGVMNECLGWRGLGHCDGGDIGSGTINVFCFVVDAKAAKEVVVAELKKAGLLKGAIIAVQNDEDYTVIWPNNFVGEFSLI
jgi:hypothetical protein